MKDIIVANNELDNYGLLTERMPTDAPSYDFKKIKEYCRLHNKALSEMTEEEIQKFQST